MRASYSESNQYAAPMAQNDYAQARRRAFWRGIWRRLSHQCNDLAPTGELLKSIHIQGVRNLGLRQVPMERIVGSSGRYRDFDLVYQPLRQEQDGRWENIARARYKGIDLPPPNLLKIGNAYFVEDGNYRISVARARGQESIEALVTAFDSPDLIAQPSCTRLGFKPARGTAGAGDTVSSPSRGKYEGKEEMGPCAHPG
jgi:hypothetical protein